MANQNIEQESEIELQTNQKKVSAWRDFYKRLKKNKSALIGFYVIVLLTIISIVGPLLTSLDPDDVDVINRFSPPSADHWFGTDHMGRDIFTRIIHGMQYTLGIGFAAVFMGALMGVPLGIVAGYYGGKIDSIIMRFIDILLAFPGILLALAIVSILGGSLVNVTIAVAIYAIPGFARIVRGSTLAAKKLEYVDAIRALGSSDGRIIFKHILPNVSSPVIVNATLYIASAILTAAGLSFLGMGAQPPTPEWGAMLNDGRNFMFDSSYIAFFPGIAIVIVVLAFNIFGDGLRDALDPKLKN